MRITDRELIYRGVVQGNRYLYFNEEKVGDIVLAGDRKFKVLGVGVKFILCKEITECID